MVNSNDSDRKQQEQEKREKFVLNLINEVKPRILFNYYVIEDKPYPIITPEDIIDHEDPTKCSYCYLHSNHTPCGPQLTAMNECREKNGQEAFNAETSRNTNTMDMYKDPCFPLFAEGFFPCFYKLESHPYYYLRSNLLFALSTKNLMKLHFEIQKFASVTAIKHKRIFQ
ncbi:hypothetical protein ABK040_006786 [Willaertia magna]